MLFARSLQQIEDSADLLRVLGRYIHFNATFGGGVANLAGEIAVRQDLFRDPEEPIDILADCSIEVASNIFAAAVDEFDERSTRYHDTHRTLAKATLKATGAFCGYDTAALNAAVRPDEATLTAIRKVRHGYRVGQRVEEAGLFQGMGFHLGSELLADEEFRILDGYCRASQPELAAFLENTKIEIGGEQHAAYYWIRIHTSVEADHFEFAVQGANLALRCYAGTADRARVKAWILQGFQEFADVQTDFMQSLLKA
jgi:hypothetical protein